MKPYSADLRQRVVQALQDGQTQPAVAQRFDLSLSSVQRYARKWREHKDLAPKPTRGRARTLSQVQQSQLGDLVRSRSDWTLQSLSHAWQQHSGQSLSVATMHRCLHRGGYSFKRRAASPPTRSRVSAKSATKKSENHSEKK